MKKLQKVSRSGQVTIPKEIREALSLKDGDYIEVSLGINSIIITPMELIYRPRQLDNVRQLERKGKNDE